MHVIRIVKVIKDIVSMCMWIVSELYSYEIRRSGSGMVQGKTVWPALQDPGFIFYLYWFPLALRKIGQMGQKWPILTCFFRCFDLVLIWLRNELEIIVA